MEDEVIEGVSLSEFFNMNTGLDYCKVLQLNNHIENVKKNNKFFKEASEIFKDKKENVLVLPKPDSCVDMSLFKALRKRKSIREFNGEPITIRLLSTLLYYSFGCKEAKDDSSFPSYFYPVAGGFNSLRVFVRINNVTGIKNDIYLYNPKHHILEPMNKEIKNDYNKITGSYEIAKKCNVSLHIAGDMEFIGYKYGERAYRFMNLEAGHAVQNVYLISAALDIGCVASGGFLDSEFFEYYSINAEKMYLLYETFIGAMIKINENL